MTKKVLFVDIGGVLLTNGWDRQSRKLAAEKFHLDFNEMEERHRLTFDLYELALDLSQAVPEEVIYIEDRSFFVEVASNIGIRSIHHTSLEATK